LRLVIFAIRINADEMAFIGFDGLDGLGREGEAYGCAAASPGSIGLLLSG
jgi:hypothetical protein